jgi:DNA (cytosine-5)-methyltransferase 1
MQVLFFGDMKEVYEVVKKGGSHKYYTIFDKDNKVTKPFKSIELFAGAGGLALGLEKAGLEAVLLSELNKHACNTLKSNRPHWNIVQGDVAKIDFTPYKGNIDFLSGGFPCQAFSYTGKRLGFEDARGTLFFEFARAVQESQPSVFLGENVRGLLNHDGGKTLEVIRQVIDEIGYELIVEPTVLKAMYHRVPQKRERLFLVGVRKDIMAKLPKDAFKLPQEHERTMMLKDALYAGELYDCDVPLSHGQSYPEKKKKVLDLVPQGGYWKDLPDDIQREYMKKSYFLGGGKTGMARRLSMNAPSLTLTCAPAQNQTERCHPLETRPLTVREYARIQTFPDNWEFKGSMAEQYKQIGNAVPVNLAHAIGNSIVALLNEIEKIKR